MMEMHIHHHIHAESHDARALTAIALELAHVKCNTESIMSTQTELAEQLKSVKDQIVKVDNEQAARFDALTARIVELEAIMVGGGEVQPAVSAALAEVRTALQELDDTIPDAV